MKKIVFPIFILLLITACNSDKPAVTEKPVESVVDVPAFSADSAYYYVEKQVNMGPRVPGTDAHRELGDYLVASMNRFGAEVVEQEFQATSFDGVNLDLRNIIASFYPEKTKRILLAAHYDTRPFADKDSEREDEPIDGANDGASGVGVLLEIARQLSASETNVGIDMIFFDGEDWGERVNDRRTTPPEGYDYWWCLGSQYWSKNKHVPNYSAYYGILLDMVGAKGSQFYPDAVSQAMAPRIVRKVWDRAANLGYGGIFVPKEQGEILDDHVFVNSVAKIPMVDIVHYDPELGFFGDYHHTHDDNMDLIDKGTLRIVGDVVLNVIYNE